MKWKITLKKSSTGRTAVYETCCETIEQAIAFAKSIRMVGEKFEIAPIQAS